MKHTNHVQLPALARRADSVDAFVMLARAQLPTGGQ